MAPINQISQCKGGNKKALLIAVRDVGIKDFPVLHNVHRDTVLLQRLLIDVYGYPENNVVVMMDKQSVRKELWPTKENIRKQVRFLVQGVSPEDHLFFYYAGHGGQAHSNRYSEADGFDEVILTCTGNQIKDNRLKKWLVNPLPNGCKLFVLWDSCHSVTILDLDHHMCNDPELQGPEGERSPRRYRESRPRLAFMKSVARASLVQRTLPPISMFKCDGKCERPLAEGKDRAHVISLSACKDNEAAFADDHENGTVTKFFVDHLRENPQLTLLQLLTVIRKRVDGISEAHQELDMQTKVPLRDTNDPGTRDNVRPVRRNTELDVRTLEDFLRATRKGGVSTSKKPGYTSHYRLDLNELVDL
ncbi:hypothetical protein BDN67DRAFT_1006159 [Paxillus ammoniavirescens]|nr:hypothetical protein BDN67DRAFT_1006159 [Paxillus ammoniavirescens]